MYRSYKVVFYSYRLYHALPWGLTEATEQNMLRSLYTPFTRSTFIHLVIQVQRFRVLRT